ncbi:F0F1 ATP synthase subunit beta [bacterium (Candidatus Blackallbacteria) CG17_big_fil_post_rev_8_21_14_2_50_48_46]|uniref:F0F1 ATP synthase subunit beta n=1 Tax=bacterium (Candidatus Blackallbacteria) CG17_big_fil_post_rev_8_21_14_2_50_48_46 TaxID=2014261 RepID=A0A2M7G0X3_9BACT|nr:MAG: F0F1 ATP synthase subunit beta [bacterium (Candidatus Blackallbacteria) CG18_big_fil_WC_8_21_14_2_50_49_26]PIW15354.1 MAG: F0F1 ATP synthase subunit beta [bacterium (Candidatus Blackallbacteria) CG17_big_fil_post_rev_8_21_14_2_50_48_46]PIW49785.1 MAG: F0F1 ATP synthase subunit beta [bacterium (Candidatus Blackallbacteria) CG13_big_fil_rev_8_21_14_2_50_49_14]
MSGVIQAIKESVVEVVFSSDIPEYQEVLTVTATGTVLEVAILKDQHTCLCIVLGKTLGLARGMGVERSFRGPVVRVGEAVLGRALNALGEPIDQQGALGAGPDYPVYRSSPLIVDQNPRKVLLETGIKLIDLLTPFVKGGKIGLFGGAGVGKTILLTEFVYKIITVQKGVSIFAGIGERIREAHELWHELKRMQVLDKSTVILGQMNEPPGVRFRAVFPAIAMAEYFRDEMGTDVLLLIDNIFRFAQAGMEVSTLLGRLPARAGYQPTLKQELAMVEERITSTENASITSVQAIYVPADDITDPAPASAFSHLDTAIILSRERASKGFYPSIDLLASSSKLLDPDVVGLEHYQTALNLRFHLQRYKDLEDVIAMLGLEELTPSDRLIVERARKLERFLTQPFFTTEVFTGRKGRHVPLAETIRGCSEIMAGAWDAVDESHFYLIGGVDEIARA